VKQTYMFPFDRAQPRSTRRALIVAGVATIAFSLIVAIAPAMAAQGGNSDGNNGNGNNDGNNGNGNAGVAQVHDATTDLEAGEQANEPSVCTFWVGFYASNPTEAGTWQVLSWPPTGDGSVVASGTYDTAGDGVDATGDLALTDGHYRLEWQTDGDNNTKHKTFWVDCEATDDNPGDETPGDETPGDETPGDETPGDETPGDETNPDEEVEGGDGSNNTPPAEEDPDANDDGDPSPEDDVLGGNPGPVASPPASEGDAAPAADGGAADLPDTSLPVQPSGVLATIGVLLIIAAHMGTRRARSLPTA
jgi:hypothetical protein